MTKQKKNWVDYKVIKRKVSLAQVLERYGVLSKLKQSGQNMTGVCPIHQGANPRQFSVNLERNLWNCFGFSEFTVAYEYLRLVGNNCQRFDFNCFGPYRIF